MARVNINKIKKFEKSFIFVNLVLLLCLVVTFSATEYIMFYISFESSLIPTLILILGWGYQPERIQAGVYMLFYTLFFSLPLLGSLLVLRSWEGSLSIKISMDLIGQRGFVSGVWFLFTILAFLVKLPIYRFHL